MSGWDDRAVREALGLSADAARERAYTGVSTDTRRLEEGALFVALAGENYDAHDFLDEAAEAGARGAVVERIPGEAPDRLVYYRVDDTLAALGGLARYYRRRLGDHGARVCAITGTNGKTSTKNMARAVLGSHLRVHATEANLNNLIGAPLTLLDAPEDAEAVVVEVGTNAPGEIARLGEIVEPDAAIITNVAAGHLEGLGSVEGVLQEKTALIKALRPDGIAFVGEEPAALARRARSLSGHVRVAGWSERADPELRAEEVRLDEDGRVRFRWRGREVRLAFRGRALARNALLALGLGLEWGVDADAAAAALARVEPTGMRSETRRYGDLTVIVDCYNANPASLEAAVDALTSMPRGGGRVAVVGTMLELGAEREALHRESAELLAAADLDRIVATGAFVEAFAPLADRLGERLIAAEDPLDAYDPLAAHLSGDEVVLLKGSRGVALERLLPRFRDDWGDSSAPDGRAGDGPVHGTGG